MLSTRRNGFLSPFGFWVVLAVLFFAAGAILAWCTP